MIVTSAFNLSANGNSFHVPLSFNISVSEIYLSLEILLFFMLYLQSLISSSKSHFRIQNGPQNLSSTLQDLNYTKQKLEPRHVFFLFAGNKHERILSMKIEVLPYKPVDCLPFPQNCTIR